MHTTKLKYSPLCRDSNSARMRLWGLDGDESVAESVAIDACVRDDEAPLFGPTRWRELRHDRQAQGLSYGREGMRFHMVSVTHEADPGSQWAPWITANDKRVVSFTCVASAPHVDIQSPRRQWLSNPRDSAFLVVARQD